jgi:hypothetical protein
LRGATPNRVTTKWPITPLLAVAVINTKYVEAKGKTFFARHLLFENP